MCQRYAGRTVVVTGATGGIGGACAHRLSAEGAHVVAVGRDAVAGEELRRELDQLGGSGAFVIADLSTAEGIDACTDALLGLGRVDCLVNGAGVSVLRRAARLTASDFARAHLVNTVAPSLLTARIGSSMAERGGGAVVSIGSIAGSAAMPLQAPYSASKAGLVGAVLSLASELAPAGVRVNVVAPGLVRTAMSRDAWDDPARAATMTDRIPLRRIGGADEIASTVAFLGSDDASYVTGQVLHVDGGLVGQYSLLD